MLTMYGSNKNTPRFSFLILSVLTILLILSVISSSYAQVSINTDGANPDGSAMLDITSSDRGVLLPRMSTAEREAINNPATGLIVYDTTSGSFWYFEAGQWNELQNRITDSITSLPIVEPLEEILLVPNPATAMVVKDDYLYVLEEVDEFIAFDISNPQNIFIADELAFPGSPRLQDLDIKGDLAFIINETTNGDDVYIVNISNPSALVLQQSFDVGNSLISIKIKEDYAFCYDWGAEALVILSIADPSNVTVVSTLPSIPKKIGDNDEEGSILIQGDRLYLLHSFQGTDVMACSLVDIADVNNPILLSTIALDNLDYDDEPFQLLEVNDQTVYVTSRNRITGSGQENVILDISDPNGLTVAGAFPPTYGMILSGGYLFAGSESGNNTELVTFDISNPLAPLEQSAVVLPTNLSNASEVRYLAVKDAYLYYSLNDDQLGVVKLFEEYVTTQFGNNTNVLAPLYDNLGNHRLEKNLITNGFWINGDNQDEGIWVNNQGRVGINKNNPQRELDVNGTIRANSFQGNGAALTNAGTDDQKIDKLNLNGTLLEISLEGDGENDQTVDLSSLIPIGTIQMWPTNTPPTGWLLCNGSSFAGSTYPELQALLGGTNLPNFTGRFPLGVGNSGTNGSTNHNIKSTGGAEKHQLTVNEMPSHSHGAGSLSTTEPFLSQNGSGNQDKRDGGGTKLFEYSGITGNTASIGGNQAHNNMPPFYTIQFIIKAQ
ncbi:MAG: tail fiber protein [Bacteroidota bacterium]